TYRTALRSSKPRNRGEEEEQEVITVYYRLHSKVAIDLSLKLPLLVSPDTWQSEQEKDRPGQLFVISSEPDFSNIGKSAQTATASKQPTTSLIVERSVLIIQQTRAAHNEITKIIRRVRTGDGGGGGASGGGGFGSGFFSIQPDQASRARR
ncbi:MAG: hypothetical protein VB858_03570, partial [Planctomycetaceae bacterium]